MKIYNWLAIGFLICFLAACGSDGSDEDEQVPTADSNITTDAETVSSKEEEPVAEQASDTETGAADEGKDNGPAVQTDEETQEVLPPKEDKGPVDYEAYGVNELGHIMVVMYHGIMDNPPYHRTKDQFLKDLTYMYDHDYRVISMTDYLSGHIDIPAGMTPIVLTFDDGLNTTFSLTESGSELKVTEDTAVDLMEDFAQNYPDFGKEASFYIHATDSNFDGAGTAKERLEWLVNHGYEIGNHTKTHANLSKLGRDALLEEIGSVEVYVDQVIPGYELVALTYPFGARPTEDLRSLVYEGSYEGYSLTYSVAFREGPSGQFYPPMHTGFQSYNAPRVRGSEGEVQDMWWFFDYYEANPGLKYVSDGDPDTLVIPESMQPKLREDVDGAFDVIVY